MKKLQLLFLALLVSSFVFSIPWKSTDRKLSADEAKVIIEKIQNESFLTILPSNIVASRVYTDLAKEGWTLGEIIRITDEYLAAHKPELKKEGSNVDYAKYWRPYYVSSSLLNSTISDYTNPKELERVKEVVESTQDEPNAYYPRIFYTPTDRLAGIRNTGYFRQNAIMPAGGRMHWMAMHPENPDKLMVIPDSEGIYRTDDMGKTWDCIVCFQRLLS